MNRGSPPPYVVLAGLSSALSVPALSRSAVSSLPVARLFRANLESCTYFWFFIALVATIFWLLFYVV